MSALLPLVVAVPFAAAVLSMLVRSPLLSRALLLVVPALVVCAGVALVMATSDGSVVATQVAGWVPGVAIPFAADMLSALMLTVSGILVLAGVVFAIASRDDDDAWFAPMVLLMTAGVYGAYLTADLFNLFVMIEVALLPSYVLLARRGTPSALGATRVYLAVNLAASTILLGGVGLVYATAGTVNLAQLSGLAAGAAPVAVATGVVVIALSIKAALVPVHTWLPTSYPAASPAVTALFSGLLTKIGVYGLIRITTLVVAPSGVVRTMVIVVTLVTMVVGVLGALGSSTMRGVLSFHMVSQVGYILIGVALAGVAGVAAVVFYLVHHTVVKTSLFMSLGAIEVRRGTGRLDELGGEARLHRWVTLAFFVGALSLIGLPPLSGFWAKYQVLTSAAVDTQTLVVVVALVVSVGTLMSMLKVGNGVFWGERPSPAPEEQGRDPHPRHWAAALVAPGLVLAAASLAVGLWPQWLLELTQTAASGLAAPELYVEAVLSP